MPTINIRECTIFISRGM